MSSSIEVAVVGSINLDLSFLVERFPDPGETVQGYGLHRGGGGKGANQAVAAARLGRQVALIGRVGADDANSGMRAALAGHGVETNWIVVDEQESSGLAFIEVDASGENRIVVVPGANKAVCEADLDAASGVLESAAVTLVQLEIPVPVVESLARRPRSGLLVLNPAPATALDLTGVDIVVPNRTELGLLAGQSPVEFGIDRPSGSSPEQSEIEQVVDQALAIDGDPSSVVVTLGSQGVVVVQGLRDTSPTSLHIPALPVEVVDTTGAGDAFCAALADALCLGSDLVDAARWANRVAAAAVTRRGAWPSLPSRSEVLS